MTPTVNTPSATPAPTSPPLAATLHSFEAVQQHGSILIVWETVSDVSNRGFNLYRSTSPSGPQAQLAFLPAQAPGIGQGASYEWVDMNVSPGVTYNYWLEVVDTSGATTWYGPVDAAIQSPSVVQMLKFQVEPDRQPDLSWPVAILIDLLGLAKDLTK